MQGLARTTRIVQWVGRHEAIQHFQTCKESYKCPYNFWLKLKELVFLGSRRHLMRNRTKHIPWDLVMKLEVIVGENVGNIHPLMFSHSIVKAVKRGNVLWLLRG